MLLPEWLNWVKGVVEFEDMPLSSSHEDIPLHAALRVIRDFLVLLCLEMLEEVAEKQDDYKKLYEQINRCRRTRR